MAAVSIQYILDELQDYNLVCWTVKNGKDLLAEQDDPNMSASESAALLQRKVQGISDARLTISLSGVNKAGRKGAETHRIRTYILETAATKSMSIAGHTPEIERLHHEILDKEREILGLKYALEKANDQIESLKKEIEEEDTEEEEKGLFGLSPAMISQATQLLSMLNNIGPAKQPEIHGTPDIAQTYRSLDPKADEVIEAICYFSKYDPGSYSMYKSVLLSQAANLKKKHGPL